MGAGSAWPGGSGFLGLRFELGAAGTETTHYGFLELSVDTAGSPTPYAIRPHAFAYETTPDTQITSYHVVPEPSPAWMFAIGLVGMAMHRGVPTHADENGSGGWT